MRDTVFFALMLSVVAMLTVSAVVQSMRCVTIDEHYRRADDAYERGYEDGRQAVAVVQTQTERAGQ